MYHIDLSFLKCCHSNDDTVEMNELQYNDIYKSLIINNLNERHYNISGCQASGLDLEHRIPIDGRKIIEATCSGLLGCHFCQIPEEMNDQLFPDDLILVNSDECLEIATVRMVGELVSIKRQSMGLFGEELPKYVRKVTSEDLERVEKNLADEKRAVPIFRKAITKFNLDMKLVSIHYQFDRKKLFFFYTADGRVDFRELAKELAGEFKTRIELRQIGVRDEAKKIGGLGTCGREYCCISFLGSFKRITTQLASDQNLMPNMGKLSGPCGKLKCCLSFEIE